MGFFSWNCKGCNQSIKAPYGLGSLAWQNDAVVQLENGTRIVGSYDGYGRVGGVEGGDLFTAEWWHKKCWHDAGKPAFSGPSSPAQDQGYFFDDPSPKERKMPTTGEDWQLYTSSMKCGTAARSLTAALKRGIKTGDPRKAYDIWSAASIKYAAFGAADTEPRNVALDYIEQHFDVSLDE